MDQTSTVLALTGVSNDATDANDSVFGDGEGMSAGGDPLDGGGVMAVDAVRLMRRLKDADPRERRVAAV